MTVKILRPTMRGHAVTELPKEEAKQLIHEEAKKAYVIDTATGKVLQKIELTDGQTLAILPKLTGG